MGTEIYDSNLLFAQHRVTWEATVLLLGAKPKKLKKRRVVLWVGCIGRGVQGG